MRQLSSTHLNMLWGCVLRAAAACLIRRGAWGLLQAPAAGRGGGGAAEAGGEERLAIEDSLNYRFRNRALLAQVRPPPPAPCHPPPIPRPGARHAHGRGGPCQCALHRALPDLRADVWAWGRHWRSHLLRWTCHRCVLRRPTIPSTALSTPTHHFQHRPQHSPQHSSRRPNAPSTLLPPPHREPPGAGGGAGADPLQLAAPGGGVLPAAGVPGGRHRGPPGHPPHLPRPPVRPPPLRPPCLRLTRAACAPRSFLLPCQALEHAPFSAPGAAERATPPVLCPLSEMDAAVTRVGGFTPVFECLDCNSQPCSRGLVAGQID